MNKEFKYAINNIAVITVKPSYDRYTGVCKELNLYGIKINDTPNTCESYEVNLLKDNSLILEFNKFIGNNTIISFDKNNIVELLGDIFHKINNPILDLKELIYVVEPWQPDLTLKDTFEKYTSILHTSVTDEEKILLTTSALLCRLWRSEENLKSNDHLYTILKNTEELLQKWGWFNYLLKPVFFDSTQYSYVKYGDDSQIKANNNLSNNIKYSRYEELLKDKDIWQKGEDFNYEFREDQLAISKKIRENFMNKKRIFIEAPTGSGKTFAYVLIVAIATYINSLEKRVENSSFVISTDTKELQNQLINKDIPNILSKLNLLDKIKYGAMKGKNNYLCYERIKLYTNFNTDLIGFLAQILIKRLVQSGKYGDIENLSLWCRNHFKLDLYFKDITCDSEKCNLDKCKKPCFLRNRYEELPWENITVINHSLLASWPYSEKKKIFHLIIDEAHNLMEKCYDFFSEEFNSLEFCQLLDEIENGKPDIFFMLRKLNAEYGYKENIDRSALFNSRDNVIHNVYSVIDFFRKLKLSSKKYNLIVEYYNPPKEYENILPQLSGPLNLLRVSIYNLWNIISNYIKNIVIDVDPQGDSDFQILSNYSVKLKLAHDVIDNFLTASKEQAKILEVSKELSYFTLKNVPLQVGGLVNDYLLNEVQSTAFVSATLTTNGSFLDIKKHLGQLTANDFKIPAVFNLKRQTRIFISKDIGSYNSTNFISNSAQFIFDLASKLNGHTLVLFTNNYRRDEVYNELTELVKKTKLEVYTNKKAINYLNDINREVIILGTKGFFEGIDIPGDGLCCVILDKLPNYNVEYPILKAITTYYDKQYYQVNYPQLCIKIKQSYGRLIRSSMDYGYFIILDGGNNNLTLTKLENDIGGPRILKVNRDVILKCMGDDFVRWQNQNLKNILKSSINFNDFNNITKKHKSFWKYKGKSSDNKLLFNFKNRKVIYETNVEGKRKESKY